MTKKYKLKFKLKLPSGYEIPDVFNDRISARQFIDDWGLNEYKPDIVSFEDLDDFRLEEYPNIKKSDLYPKGSDMYKYYTHQEMMKDWNERFKESSTYDLTDDGTGKKYDTGKPMAGTVLRVFPRALMAVGACIKFGTTKYPNPKNWQLVENGYERYQDSLIRHILKHQQNILIDSETKLPHLYHALWNMLAITELYLMEHPELMEELNK